ncbi:MAG TPA: double zinc ribbon domain-containing protein [Caulobacteraceae bacterium]|jgi:hypothetical protein
MALQDGDDRRLRKARPWVPGLRICAAVSRALDLLYPAQALDGDARPLSHGLSAKAWSRVHFIAEPLCDGCGAPFEYALDTRCAACLARPRAYARARSAVIYDEFSRDLIVQFKHADRLDLAPLFAGWIGRAAGDFLPEIAAIARRRRTPCACCPGATTTRPRSPAPWRGAAAWPSCPTPWSASAPPTARAA